MTADEMCARLCILERDTEACERNLAFFSDVERPHVVAAITRAKDEMAEIRSRLPEPLRPVPLLNKTGPARISAYIVVGGSVPRPAPPPPYVPPPRLIKAVPPIPKPPTIKSRTDERVATMPAIPIDAAIRKYVPKMSEACSGFYYRPFLHGF